MCFREREREREHCVCEQSVYMCTSMCSARFERVGDNNCSTDKKVECRVESPETKRVGNHCNVHLAMYVSILLSALGHETRQNVGHACFWSKISAVCKVVSDFVNFNVDDPES